MQRENGEKGDLSVNVLKNSNKSVVICDEGRTCFEKRGDCDGFVDGSLDGNCEGSLDGNLEVNFDGIVDGSLKGSLDGDCKGIMEGLRWHRGF